jgi:hypothetical protein
MHNKDISKNLILSKFAEAQKPLEKQAEIDWKKLALTLAPTAAGAGIGYAGGKYGLGLEDPLALAGTTALGGGAGLAAGGALADVYENAPAVRRTTDLEEYWPLDWSLDRGLQNVLSVLAYKKGVSPASLYGGLKKGLGTASKSKPSVKGLTGKLKGLSKMTPEKLMDTASAGLLKKSPKGKKMNAAKGAGKMAAWLLLTNLLYESSVRPAMRYGISSLKKD